MVVIKINRQEGKILIIYPEHSGLKNEIKPFTGNRNALGTWRLQIRSYVMNTMMAYYNNRLHALTKVMNAERQIALMEIRKTMLAKYEGKDLEYFLWQVMKLAKHVVDLAPGKQSKHLTYFETVIYPMFLWMEKHLRQRTTFVKK